jgi:hypothetical protein
VSVECRVSSIELLRGARSAGFGFRATLHVLGKSEGNFHHSLAKIVGRNKRKILGGFQLAERREGVLR